MPDTTGAFFSMYIAVQPRLVTEFVYRHAPSNQKASTPYPPPTPPYPALPPALPPPTPP